MKITKEYLKRIIKEELEETSHMEEAEQFSKITKDEFYQGLQEVYQLLKSNDSEKALGSLGRLLSQFNSLFPTQGTPGSASSLNPKPKGLSFTGSKD